jgi:putative transcriptional regulator
MMKNDPNPAIDAALLEMAQDGLLSRVLSDKITMRLIGKVGVVPSGTAVDFKPEPLTPEEIHAIRKHANMSQAVFAQVLNVSAGYISQIERGVKRPTGAIGHLG